MRIATLLLFTALSAVLAGQANAQIGVHNAMMRHLGWGWSDGYHAPRCSQHCSGFCEPACSDCAHSMPISFSTPHQALAVSKIGPPRSLIKPTLTSITVTTTGSSRQLPVKQPRLPPQPPVHVGLAPYGAPPARTTPAPRGWVEVPFRPVSVSNREWVPVPVTSVSASRKGPFNVSSPFRTPATVANDASFPLSAPNFRMPPSQRPTRQSWMPPPALPAGQAKVPVPFQSISIIPVGPVTVTNAFRAPAAIQRTQPVIP